MRRYRGAPVKFAVVMIAVSGWMAWFSRRAMKAHKGKIEEMVREMREVIDEDDREPPAEH